MENKSYTEVIIYVHMHYSKGVLKIHSPECPLFKRPSSVQTFIEINADSPTWKNDVKESTARLAIKKYCNFKIMGNLENVNNALKELHRNAAEYSMLKELTTCWFCEYILPPLKYVHKMSSIKIK